MYCFIIIVGNKYRWIVFLMFLIIVSFKFKKENLRYWDDGSVILSCVVIILMEEELLELKYL